MEKVQLNVRISKDTYEDLKKLREKFGLPRLKINFMVEEAILDYISDYENFLNNKASNFLQ